MWRTDCFPCVPARYVLAIASCLGFVNVYALRVNLSVAIVQMDGSAALTPGANRSSTRVSEGHHYCEAMNQIIIIAVALILIRHFIGHHKKKVEFIEPTFMHAAFLVSPTTPSRVDPLLLFLWLHPHPDPWRVACCKVQWSMDLWDRDCNDCCPHSTDTSGS